MAVVNPAPGSGARAPKGTKLSGSARLRGASTQQRRVQRYTILDRDGSTLRGAIRETDTMT